jgi:hypothetical protein
MLWQCSFFSFIRQWRRGRKRGTTLAKTGKAAFQVATWSPVCGVPPSMASLTATYQTQKASCVVLRCSPAWTINDQIGRRDELEATGASLRQPATCARFRCPHDARKRSASTNCGHRRVDVPPAARPCSGRCEKCTVRVRTQYHLQGSMERMPNFCQRILGVCKVKIPFCSHFIMKPIRPLLFPNFGGSVQGRPQHANQRGGL